MNHNSIIRDAWIKSDLEWQRMGSKAGPLVASGGKWNISIS